MSHSSSSLASCAWRCRLRASGAGVESWGPGPSNVGRAEGLSLPWCSDVAGETTCRLLVMLRKKVKVKCNRQSKKKCIISKCVTLLY